MAIDHNVTRIVLVRHGESRATVERIVGGDTGCRGLTEQGVRQVEALAARLARTHELAGATALWASTLPRAIQTAEVLAPSLGGLAVQVDHALCELQPGEGDGLSWDDFEERYGSFAFDDEPYRPLAPGGESWAAFLVRTGTELSALAHAHRGGCIVVACHGGIVWGSLRCFLPLAWPGSGRALGVVANTSLTEWHCRSDSEGERLQWELVRFNDAAHLGADGHRAAI